MLKAALTKLANHDQYFCSLEDYVLVYPDQKVVINIPGSEEDFTVAKYKRELGKPYNRCDLFVCKVSDLAGDDNADNDVLDKDPFGEQKEDSLFK